MKKLGKIFALSIFALLCAIGFVACGGGDTTTIPQAPQNFTAVAGDTQVTLTWAAPASDGGSAITGYQITNDNWTTKADKKANELTHTFVGLTNGTQYAFKVHALNKIGNGTDATTTAKPSAVQTFNISLTSNFFTLQKEGGTVTGFSDIEDETFGDAFTATRAEGTNFIAKAKAYEGYRFVKWTKANGTIISTDAEYVFIVSADTALTAVFEVNIAYGAYTFKQTVNGTNSGLKAGAIIFYENGTVLYMYEGAYTYTINKNQIKINNAGALSGTYFVEGNQFIFEETLQSGGVDYLHRKVYTLVEEESVFEAGRYNAVERYRNNSLSSEDLNGEYFILYENGTFIYNGIFSGTYESYGAVIIMRANGIAMSGINYIIAMIVDDGKIEISQMPTASSVVWTYYEFEG